MLVFVPLALIVAAGRLWSYTRASRRRVPGQGTPAASPPDLSLVGGLMWTRRKGFGGGNATVPLVRLSLHESGLRLGPSTALVRPLIPTLDVSYDEIADAQAVSHRRKTTTGILLRAPQADLWVVFMKPRSPGQLFAALDVLERHEVAVSRDVRHIGWFDWIDG